LDRASICWRDKVDYWDRLVLEGCDIHLNTKKILDFVECWWFQLVTLTWGSQDVTCSGCSIILSCRLIAALVSSPVKLAALAKRGLLMSWYFQRARYTSRNMAEAPVKTVGFEMPTKQPGLPESIAIKKDQHAQNQECCSKLSTENTCTGHYFTSLVDSKS
jgi:hypothetical protein